MPDYPYRATVLVPVYNVETYLHACLNSLINQTANFSEIEVLLINDGSTDDSEAICREYAEKYDNIVLFSKENEGLSKTRNFGLKHARGRYVFFLDSDDTLRDDTLKEVTDFFDSVYDEVDLVTYRITQYYRGRPSLVHYRYRTLVKSGVYDLNDPMNRFISQTNINICVKNGLGIEFSDEPNFRHEDEKFCCDVLRRRMKIGFCSKGEYIYNRNNADSIVSTQFAPEKIFDTSISFYESIFADFPGKVPPYFQGVVFNDLRWKLKENKLLPSHLQGDEWKNAVRRVAALLERIDEDIIVLHPTVPEAHIHFWLKLKPNAHPVAVADSHGVSVYSGGRRLCTVNSIKARAEDGKITLTSPVFFHLARSRVKAFNGDIELDFDFQSDLFAKPFDNVNALLPALTVTGEELQSLRVSIDCAPCMNIEL